MKIKKIMLAYPPTVSEIVSLVNKLPGEIRVFELKVRDSHGESTMLYINGNNSKKGK